MTFMTNDYLEYYLTLLGWIINNGIWNMISDTGLFAVPFVAIVMREWLKVRGEGADEGNKGVLSLARIETHIYVGYIVVALAGIPVVNVSFDTIVDPRPQRVGRPRRVRRHHPPDQRWAQRPGGAPGAVGAGQGGAVVISSRVVSVALGCLLLVGLGAAGGVWLGARHYRPQLDAASADLAACRSARGSLEAAVVEQGGQIAALRQAGEHRARDAAQAVERGRQQAAEQYAGAQRLLSQRTAGEQCAAAEAVIDQELGL